MVDEHHYNVAFGSSDAIQISGPPCCARISRDGRTGWCRLADQHVGSHDGVLSVPSCPPSYRRGVR